MVSLGEIKTNSSFSFAWRRLKKSLLLLGFKREAHTWMYALEVRCCVCACVCACVRAAMMLGTAKAQADWLKISACECEWCVPSLSFFSRPPIPILLCGISAWKSCLIPMMFRWFLLNDKKPLLSEDFCLASLPLLFFSGHDLLEEDVILLIYVVMTPYFASKDELVSKRKLSIM